MIPKEAVSRVSRKQKRIRLSPELTPSPTTSTILYFEPKFRDGMTCTGRKQDRRTEQTISYSHSGRHTAHEAAVCCSILMKRKFQRCDKLASALTNVKTNLSAFGRRCRCGWCRRFVFCNCRGHRDGGCRRLREGAKGHRRLAVTGMEFASRCSSWVDCSCSVPFQIWKLALK